LGSPYTIRIRLALLAILGLSLFATEVSAGALYSITDLGIESLPAGISPNGTVYGTAEGQPILYQNGQRVSIPGLSGGASTASYNNLGQAAINVVNQAQTSSIRAYLEGPGGVKDLGSLGGANTIAAGLNSMGEVAGAAQTSSGDYHAFATSGGQLLDLGTLGGAASGATAINDSGQVVGSSATGSGANHAFLFDGHKMLDIGTLGGTNSQATAINSSGLIVGSSATSSGVTHAFLYSAGAMHDLGSLGDASYAYGINASGQIIGMAYVPNSTGGVLSHAFFSSGGPLVDLNSLIPANSGWILESATGISTDGTIVGYGLFNGVRHGFVLTPVPVPVPSPEPASIAFFAVVLASIGGPAVVRRRRGRAAGAA
jgi:probable HAF family extracellular repeat protein